MTKKEKIIEMLKLSCVALPVILVAYYFLNKFFPNIFGWEILLGIGIVLTLTATYFVSNTRTLMKLVFFFGYHILVFGLIYLIVRTYIQPYFMVDWMSMDWLRKFVIIVSQLTFIGFLVNSILSCFSSKKLKKDEIGQWALSEWMPRWGNNQENSWFGLFLGLPEWMVEVKGFKKVSEVISETKQIQIEEHLNTQGRKFAVDFQFSFQYRIVDTLNHILRPNNNKDLVNLIVTRLTEWLNDPTHNFKNIAELKPSKGSIQSDLRDVLVESGEMFGDEIENFLIIDIEVPQNVIEQQNKDAAARAAQLATDEREDLDIASAVKQANALVEASKDTAGNPSLTFAKALEEVRTLKGITKTAINKNRGKGTSINFNNP